ncbi:unnamed protein product [Cylindrotheca closterium]|uniref:Reverse transcriptase/retrotransposon-derived protein RNase H-like domain-containing protein n=1 Tax=Cylindrotheca closterium TaxID=2856 RepID=A0AAD2CYC2_9STRA|nr:unnamed protein product [Cylindrotheca closterium]
MENQMYMKKVNSAIPYMSEILDPLDKAEFKRVFFNVHPKPWKDAFLEINSTIGSHSIASITSYMQRKAGQAHNKELKNRLHQKIESKKKKRTAGVHHRDNSKPFKKSHTDPEEKTKRPRTFVALSHPSATILLADFEEADVYIDNVGIFSNNWNSHLDSLRKILQMLQVNGFTCNLLKCEFCVQETDWLGYWLTPTGIKPWKKKIDAILRLKPSKSVLELRSFIGAVTFYNDMFPKRSHILAPLTARIGHNKKKLDWTPECQKAFDHIKTVLSKDAFLAYPDHNQPFHVYCDASDYQLGVVRWQNSPPGWNGAGSSANSFPT